MHAVRPPPHEGRGQTTDKAIPFGPQHHSRLGVIRQNASRQMAQSAVQGSSSPVIGARGVFGFDLNKPLRGGWLLKQGGSHKAFKKRFFVLYPGFLIYYSSPDKYKYDVARNTLAVSRLQRAWSALEGVCAVIIPPSLPLLLLSLPHSFPSSEPSLCHQAQGCGDPHG